MQVCFPDRQSAGNGDFATGEVGLVSIQCAIRMTQLWFLRCTSYFEPFEVTGITHPDQLGGPHSLWGCRFRDEPGVFGNKQGILVERASSTSIVGVIPEGEAPGSVSVHLWTEAGFRTLEDGFTYLSSLEIESVDPWVVSTDGGELVRVTGKGFRDTTVVELGGIEVTAVLEDGALVFTSPGLPGGWNTLVVSSDDGEESDTTNCTPLTRSTSRLLQRSSRSFPQGSTVGGIPLGRHQRNPIWFYSPFVSMKMQRSQEFGGQWVLEVISPPSPAGQRLNSQPRPKASH